MQSNNNGGWSIPWPGFEWPNSMTPSKEHCVDDVETGSIWRDDIDDSLWKVSHKDDRIHIINLSDSTLRVCGVNLFFNSYSLVEYGAVCFRCKRNYQYAVKSVNFECWGCKNGA
jgi:hypothetical protein